MEIQEPMGTMLLFALISRKINGMYLMILWFANAAKIVSIMEILIFYYMNVSLNKFNYLIILYNK